MPLYDDQRAKLAGLHGLMGRVPARAQGLKIFNGPECPVRGHGRTRRITDGRCISCLEDVAAMKKAAQKEGREAALKRARAEVAREQRREERAKLKAEADALKARQLAERRRAAETAKRARRRAERATTPESSVEVSGPLHDSAGLAEDSVADDSPDIPPWD